jgi:hypothetical protein
MKTERPQNKCHFSFDLIRVISFLGRMIISTYIFIQGRGPVRPKVLSLFSDYFGFQVRMAQFNTIARNLLNQQDQEVLNAFQIQIRAMKEGVTPDQRHKVNEWMGNVFHALAPTCPRFQFGFRSE